MSEPDTLSLTLTQTPPWYGGNPGLLTSEIEYVNGCLLKLGTNLKNSYNLQILNKPHIKTVPTNTR